MAVTIYVVVGPSSGWATPTASEVKLGQLSGGSAATWADSTADPGGTGTINWPDGDTTGLSAGVSYRTAFVASDGTTDGTVSVSDVWVAASAAVTLVADNGVYAASGQSAALLTARALAANQGTYTQAGQAAGLVVNRLLTAAQGTYSVTGQAAGLTYAPGASSYTLTAEGGSYASAGQDAALLAARRLVSEQGGYAFTGQDAALLRGYVVAGEQGGYSLSGQAANFARTYRVVGATGSYSLMGQSARLVYSNAEILPTLQKLPTWYYVPGPLTFTLDGLTRELQRISQASYGAAPVVQYIPQAVAPSKPRDGMTVYADGDNWNPGSGAGVYVYTTGAWNKL